MPDLPPFPSAKVDRRVDLRVPFSGPVTQYGDHGNVIWNAVNLSDSGMFLTGNPLLPIDTEIELGFKVPGYDLEVLTEGRVQWRNSPNDPDFDRSMPTGIGVLFTDIDPECARVLRKFMASHKPPEPAMAPIAEPARKPFASGLPPTPEPTLATAGAALAPTPAAAARAAAPPVDAAPAADLFEGDDIADLIADTLDEFDEPVEAPFGEVAQVTFGDEADERLLRERLQPGMVLGSYRLAKWLGSGGMGDVYLAEHTQLGRMVALKRLRSDFADNRAGLQRFFQEARAVNQIHHEHIVEITDFIQEGEHTYCVMEYLDGPTLAELCESVGIVPLQQALSIGLQVCDALEAVHEAGIVHRDLKPQNIMLIERIGQPHFAKLLDFGVAKLTEGVEGKVDKRSGAQTTGSLLLGTPAYMSPEQLLGNPVDHRADIYAVGVMLYEMITGTNPFVTETWGQAVVKHATHVPEPPSEVRGAAGPLPADLERLILRCLEKDPNRRPQSIAAVSAEMQRLLDAGPALAALSAAAVRAGAPTDRHRPVKRITVAAVAMLLLGGVGLLAVNQDLRPSSFAMPWEGRPPSGEIEVAPEASPAPELTPRLEPRPGAAIPARPAVEPGAALPTSSEPEADPRGRKRRKRRGPEIVTMPALAPTPPKVEPRANPKPPPKPEPKPPPKPEPKAPPKPEPKPPPKPEPKPPPKPEPKLPPEPKPKPEPALAAATAESPIEDCYKQGKAVLKQNKALLAVEQFKQCLTINPKHAKTYKMLGKAYVMLGRESDAISAFEQYVKLAPNAKDAPKVQAIIDQFKSR